ncbi:cytochrome c oxidase subunit 2A [Lentibacillus cibarius]|uniref:Cytochrome c oxidase subunit 2A n=1 Tax=Lentibacillus cibarius TaxID=2583219 RepID=A0A5S3QMD9_9BACI|nr:cytochrome c oxidase subunit 2A [Lentibacillus cibarius]TMN23060.1 cytochrome c oxidase subunit 2A [Lentibacillus cibarius]
MKASKQNAPQNNYDEKSLKGTFASVLVVAAIIVVMWAGVFALYMARV